MRAYQRKPGVPERRFCGHVRVNDRAIELWSTQLFRYGWKWAKSGGAAGIANYAMNDIRRDLDIPQGWVVRKIVKQERLEKRTGKVWYFSVIATPRRR